IWPAERIAQPTMMIESLEEMEKPKTRAGQRPTPKSDKRKINKHKTRTRPTDVGIFFSRIATTTTSELPEKISTQTETVLTEMSTEWATSTSTTTTEMIENIESNN